MKIAFLLLLGVLVGTATAQRLFSSANVGSIRSETSSNALITALGTDGTITGTARAQSGAGVLHASATATNSGGADFTYASGSALFGDQLLITGGTGTGYFLADYTVDGSLAASGTATASTQLTWEGLPNGVDGGLLTGTHTYHGVYKKKFTYGEYFAISANLYASVTFNGGVGEGTADFLNTATLSAVHIFDAEGDPVSGVTIGSASGHAYPQAVPEPASFAALGLGVAAMLRRRRTR